jgi:hypothetical protein
MIVIMIDKIKNIYKTYGSYYLNIFVLSIMSIISLFTIDFEYFLYTIVIFVMVMPILQTIEHEYICHQYVIPKNKIIDFVCLMLFYMLQGRGIEHRINYHMTHHRYWKDPTMDPTQQKLLNTSMWKYIFGIGKPVNQLIIDVDSSLLNNPIIKKLNPYAKLIQVTYLVILFLCLSWNWFVVFAFYFPWMMMLVMNFHDELFHGRIKSQDNSWYFILYGNAAWHIEHHSNFKSVYDGPDNMYLINPAWYFKKIFFKFK